MSGRKPQNKGKRGERELASTLNAMLGGEIVERTGHQQAKVGGFDLTMPNCAIEVKRYAVIKDGHIAAFWKETIKQSKEFGTVGVLAYREDNQAWRVMVPGSYSEGAKLILVPDQKFAWTLTIDGFLIWYRSTLAAEQNGKIRRLTVNG